MRVEPPCAPQYAARSQVDLLFPPPLDREAITEQLKLSEELRRKVAMDSDSEEEPGSGSDDDEDYAGLTGQSRIFSGGAKRV